MEQGTYFIRLTKETGVSNHKIIKIRKLIMTEKTVADGTTAYNKRFSVYSITRYVLGSR